MKARELWRRCGQAGGLRLGELAVARGLAEAEAEAAAAEGARRRLPIGQMLAERGRLTDEQLATLLLEQESLGGRPHERIGRYLLLYILGRGGMGVVWKAWDASLGRAVALKMTKLDGDDERARFLREARIAAKLAHPNIAPVHEVLEHDGRPCIAMGLIEGRPPEPGTLPLRRALEIVRDAARTVQAAHDAGVTHRDLKPDNLMIEPGGRVIVLDFGLAKMQRARSSLSVEGMVVGTPAYMPPEQAAGDPTGPRSDIYSLGATLYALAVGRPPYDGKTAAEIMAKVLTRDATAPRRLRPEINRDVETIILKSMERDPGRRYASASAMADDLDHFLHGEGIVAHPVSTVERAWRVVRRHPVPSTSLTLLAIVVAAFAWVALTAKSQLGRRAVASTTFEQGKRLHDDARLLLYRRGTKAPDVLKLLDLAVPVLARASAEDPTFAEPEHYLGRCQAMLFDRVDSADVHFAEALRRNPAYLDARLDRGLLSLGRMQEQFDIAGDPLPPAAALRARVAEDLELYAAGRGSGEYAVFARAALAHVRGEQEEALRLCASIVNDARLADEVACLVARCRFAMRQYDAAERSARDAIEKRPLFLHARQLLTLSLLQSGKFESCEGECAAGASLFPGYAPFWFISAKSHLLRGRPAEADEIVTTGLSAESDAAALALRGYIRFELGRPDDAITDFEAAIRADVKARVPDARSGLIEVFVARQRFEDALRVCDELASIEAWRASLGRARVQIATGAMDAARASLDKVVAQRPTCYEARFLRSRLMALTGDTAGAETEIRSAITAAPARHEAYTSLAALLLRTGRIEEALAVVEGAVRALPGVPDLRVTLALILHNRLRFNDGAKAAREALAMAPHHAAAHAILARCLAESNDAAGAVHEADEAVRLDRCANSLCARGVVCRRLGRWEDAARDLQASIALDATIEDAHENLAFVCMELGRPERAAEAYGKAAALQPSRTDLRLNLAVVLCQLKREKEAIPHLERARELAPKDARVLVQLGTACLAVGRRSDAAAAWEEAVRLDPSLENRLRPWIEHAKHQ